MARKKQQDEEHVDRKSAAAGDSQDAAGGAAEYVFDGPFDAEKAIAHLIELNHEFQACDREWERAKSVASDAKHERDNASNAISLLLDQIDRHKNGLDAAQPVLKTIPGSAEGSVN